MKRKTHRGRQISVLLRGAGILAAIAILSTTIAPVPVAATEFGDAARGATVAERWCTNCHLAVETQTKAPKDAVPSFNAIAERESTSKQELDGILSAPHGPMPTHVLSRQERADVIAYILSLKTR